MITEGMQLAMENYMNQGGPPILHPLRAELGEPTILHVDTTTKSSSKPFNYTYGGPGGRGRHGGSSTSLVHINSKLKRISPYALPGDGR
ncbi:hypothetical protein H5410_027488 [Solanum commersonii]|uniref:Uncharacterized protein n=1 Tax=Solanum commersonii TaxID=4109 RepID=A0A9J5Z3I2_SOLCO|nr:hypothetical protein H5410_027488 [Solanum commersonii]